MNLNGTPLQISCLPVNRYLGAPHIRTFGFCSPVPDEPVLLARGLLIV